MARVIGQSVPPSIAEELAKTVVMVKPQSGAGLIGRVAPKALVAAETTEQDPLAYFVSNAAEWLREAWIAALPAGTDSRFFQQRKEEMLAGVFPPTYWRKATTLEDLTEYGAPAYVLPSLVTVDPAYVDTLRQPSNCPITVIERSYPTMPYPGTSVHPSPGWQGAVEDGLFADTYQAQRRLTFALPYTVTSQDKRPLALRIATTITANASHRGNAAWFVMMHTGQLWNTATAGAAPANEMLTDWIRTFKEPTGLPPERTGGWSYSQSNLIIRNAKLRANLGYKINHNRLWIRVYTPTSRGIYYARNDWVRVHHEETVEIYQARRRYD